MMKGHAELVELLKTIQGTPGKILATDEASVCEYQDMIGHSSEEELEELANGVYKHTFYRVYGLAYGTVEAIVFFTKHGEKIKAMLTENAELKCDIEDAKDDIKKAKAEAEKYAELMTKARDEWEAEKNEKEKMQYVIDQKDYEIMQLKAKLYDLQEMLKNK